MRAAILTVTLLMCWGCTTDRAHRDCDRKLVPINAEVRAHQGKRATGPDEQSVPMTRGVTAPGGQGPIAS